MSHKKSSWENKSDKWLIEAIRSDDKQAANDAVIEFRKRYGANVEKAARAKLPPDWVDEAVQNSWIGFYSSVVSSREEISKVSNYLTIITRNKIADTLKKFTGENNIELASANLDMEIDFDDFVGGQAIDEVLAREEERIIEDTALDVAEFSPFVENILSDCQRMLWVLVRLLGLKQTVVSRLMGKDYATLRSEYRNARAQLHRFFKTEEFQYILNYSELPEALQFTPVREANAVVERFAEVAVPMLTSDELKPLGLSVEEFQTHYVASLIVPRWFKDEEQLKLNYPSLLLTRRTQWHDLGAHLRSIHDGKATTQYTPLECLIHFSVEEDHIALEPQSLVEMIPDIDPPDWSDHTYICAHQPRMTVPVIWGFWDESMVEVEEVNHEFETWPFMRNVGGWTDLQA